MADITDILSPHQIQKNLAVVVPRPLPLEIHGSSSHLKLILFFYLVSFLCVLGKISPIYFATFHGCLCTLLALTPT